MYFCSHANLFSAAGANLLKCAGGSTHAHVRWHFAGKHSCMYMGTGLCRQVLSLLLGGGTAARFGCAAHPNACNAEV